MGKNNKNDNKYQLSPPSPTKIVFTAPHAADTNHFNALQAEYSTMVLGAACEKVSEI